MQRGGASAEQQDRAAHWRRCGAPTVSGWPTLPRATFPLISAQQRAPLQAPCRAATTAFGAFLAVRRGDRCIRAIAWRNTFSRRQFNVGSAARSTLISALQSPTSLRTGNSACGLDALRASAVVAAGRVSMMAAGSRSPSSVPSLLSVPQYCAAIAGTWPAVGALLLVNGSA